MTEPPLVQWTRLDLAQEFARRGYRRGAEIGVEQGLFSEQLCLANPDLELLCVDAWRCYPGYREHVSQTKLDNLKALAVKRLAPYRCEIIERFSVEAARAIPNGSLDFVYIDGNHTLPHVIADLAAWVPKVRKGGIVSGHDYGRSSVGHVKEAIDAWTVAYRIGPCRVLRGDRSPSWWWDVV